MKFKLDEQIPVSAKNLFTSYGYDVHTVYDEGISGISDKDLSRTCKDEKRILITCDDDFINPLLIPKSLYHGIIYLDLYKLDRDHVKKALTHVLSYKPHSDFIGKRVRFIDSSINPVDSSYLLYFLTY